MKLEPFGNVRRDAATGAEEVAPQRVHQLEPFVGPGAIEGLVLATGHFRSGILLSPGAAERVVAALTEPVPA